MGASCLLRPGRIRNFHSLYAIELVCCSKTTEGQNEKGYRNVSGLILAGDLQSSVTVLGMANVEGSSVLCSDSHGEPLAGTAKTGTTYVLLEWPHAWGRDVLDGSTFGAELSAKLTQHLANYDATLLLIRHPTREGRQIGDHHLYLVFADEQVTEVLHVTGPEALLELDLSGPGNNGASIREKPMLLVCTHAKRDRCCAVKGRPVVRELAQQYPAHVGNDVVWETSHIKGHRFAATLMLMPWAYSYGRMNVEAAHALVEHAFNGLYFVPGNRGRGTLSAPAQAAELAVATALTKQGVRLGIDQLQVTVVDSAQKTATVRVEDTHAQQSYAVMLEKRPVEGVIASCGDAPKTGATWQVTCMREALPQSNR